MKKIEVIKSVSNSESYQKLYVNGYLLGEYIYGKNKLYLEPEKWANQQIKKRTKVLDRSIKMLEQKLIDYKKERESINEQ